MNHLLYEISGLLGDWGQVIGSLFTALAFWVALIQFRRSDRAHRKTEEEALEAKQIEVYQRLELESVSVFRFEAEHRAILPFYKSNLAPPTEAPRGVDREEAELCARKYYEISCNLFEIAVRLRAKGEHYVEDEVFGSWIAWFFDTACEWGFRALWHDLRDNYTPALRRDVFDPLVAELIAAWDTPHAASPSADLDMPEVAIAPIRRRFYAAVGETFGCDCAHGWVDDNRAEAFPIPPRAFA